MVLWPYHYRWADLFRAKHGGWYVCARIGGGGGCVGGGGGALWRTLAIHIGLRFCLLLCQVWNSHMILFIDPEFDGLWENIGPVHAAFCPAGYAGRRCAAEHPRGGGME